MTRIVLALTAASALTLSLGACQEAAPPTPGATDASAVPTPAVAMPPVPPPLPLPMVTPGEPSLARDPVQAMQAFTDAIEARDWQAVRGFWGDYGKASGMDEQAFVAKWSSLLAPIVTVGKGDQEGAAGSLYYTAPVMIVDGPRTIKGEVTMRRVNDVDGASPEQLRWHIESTTLTP